MIEEMNGDRLSFFEVKVDDGLFEHYQHLLLINFIVLIEVSIVDECPHLN